MNPVNQKILTEEEKKALFDKYKDHPLFQDIGYGPGIVSIETKRAGESDEDTWPDEPKEMPEDLKEFMKREHINTCNDKWRLGGRKLTKEAVFKVATLMKDWHPKVEELILNTNGIDDETAAVVANSLKSNTTCRILWIPSNAYGDPGISAFADMLKANSTLTQLNIFGHRMGVEGAKALGEALKVNTTLKELNIPRMYMTTDVVRILADAMKVNNSLEKLWMANNELGTVGAKLLAEVIKVNRGLKHLDLSYNQIETEEAIQALIAGLQQNTVITDLYLRNNNFGLSSVRALREFMKNRPSVVIHFFSWDEKMLEIEQEKKRKEEARRQEEKIEEEKLSAKFAEEDGKRIIFVVGASGDVGKRVVDHLVKQEGTYIRAATRFETRAKELNQLRNIRGFRVDIYNQKTVMEALQGVETLIIIPPFFTNVADMTKSYVEVAKNMKTVKHIIFCSMIGHDDPSTLIGKWYSAGEDIVKKSGLQWTIVRTNYFYQNIASQELALQDGNYYFAISPMVRWSPVDHRDVSDVISTIATNPTSHSGVAYNLTGSELISIQDQLTTVEQIIGRKIVYNEVPQDQFKKILTSTAFHPVVAKAVTEMLGRIQQGKQSMISQDITKVTGQQPRRFENWAKEHFGSMKEGTEEQKA